MAKKEITKIGFVGSGRVASHLAVAFYEVGIEVCQIFSKNFDNASALAAKVNASPINSICDFDLDIDLVIISITDSALMEIKLSEIPKNLFVCHTTGSVSIDIFKERENFGVLYPLQTFSFDSKPDMTKVPFCIEANKEENTNLLISFSEKLSENVYKVNYTQRRKLHLAAVFACNFVNTMYGVAENILKDSDLSLGILRPLIMETANKVQNNSPKEMQTGPAVRNDIKIMNQHIEMLRGQKEYAELYKIISNLITRNNISNEEL